MQKIKNLACLLMFSLVLFSCGEYQKVLNKGTTEEQYKMAVKLYESNKFSKALRLFEKITPTYRGKPQMERIQFMVAQSNFNEKNYSMSGYYFDRFAKNYPKSSKLEEAAFLSAYSYKLASPSFSLDPTDTNKALDAFQSFINTYPDSDKIEEANQHYKELRYKLQKKYFEIAKTYYRTAEYDLRNYKAAIQAFDNLLADYLGSEFKEEALYYRLKAAHDFVLKSYDRRKLERIKDAIDAYDKLKRNYPESQFMEDSNIMLATLQKEQVRIDALIAKQVEVQNSKKK
ncbi:MULTISPECIES: outer membrane protein assembly factor BamD [unclassified Polaribacter]|jgi:outer membrane protein assembly factor BamD|uniref:outer membrane protein assembly factor BamD n=1 Tax=unclassified Polaribacter TaxID=196858 RepID=UPI001C4E508C|nr:MULTISPECIES: outer membrane protein assembly factor BamD [unclassified Polaribacter]QXP64768.1 outer membrane protein assembly factor BamD [Polaribacter sp. HaHaR_3_91]QXP67266.1 outer membrane protein assembly factor BamD [Polaribacter sp. AHE13PA]QXP69416.1 outer membrane protein assembly factor BamD [Polaribacter sp. R2A056_3_33]